MKTNIRETRLCCGHNCWIGHFDAMASPCEVLLSIESKTKARHLVRLVAKEAWRIENKFSRYRDDSVIQRLNRSNGQPIEVDAETALLLDFAYHCFEISHGLFDISSGVLRQAWHFDGSDHLPENSQVSHLLDSIGLQKACWDKPFFTLPPGMEIDFGGIGKEYAVDKSLQLLCQQLDIPVLINFGGDIVTNRSPQQSIPWRIAIEKPGHSKKQLLPLQLNRGALATSGDAWRFLLKDGKRYSHVLDPRTGWPVEQAPRSVTVAADTCTQAGILSTLAMLQGAGAETFLTEQQVQHWIIR